MKYLIRKNINSIILIVLLVVFLVTKSVLFLPAYNCYAFEETININTLPQNQEFNNLKNILIHLDILEKYIDSYYPNKTQKEKNLIAMRLIRQLRPHYNNIYWITVAGEIDSEIKDAINYNSAVRNSLYYFEDSRTGENIIDPNTLNKIDFKHLISTLNVIMNFNNYNTCCDLAGWAGDLHSCIGDLQSQYYSPTSIKDIDYEEYASMIIGNDKYHFPIEDILADIDAYNISNKMKVEINKPLSKILLDYYLNNSEKRFLTFVNTYSFTDINSEKKILFQERVKEMTSLEYVKSWPMNDILRKYKKHDYTQAELTALGNAFLSYIQKQVMKELQKPENIEILTMDINEIEISWKNNINATGTYYQLAVFDEKNNLIKRSKWTTELRVKFKNLAPFTPYTVKGKVKAQGLDDIETDWHFWGKFFTVNYNHISPLFRIFYNKSLKGVVNNMYICPCPYYTQQYITANYSINIDTTSRRLTLLQNGNWFKSYLIAVGKPSTPSPKGIFTILNKAFNPGGPFGARWMGLSAPGGSYGIHGTNNPDSIGQAASSGCIRMYNHDVIELYNLVHVGTTVIMT